MNLPSLIKLLRNSQWWYDRYLERLQDHGKLTHAKASPLSERQWCLDLSAFETSVSGNCNRSLTRGELKIQCVAWLYAQLFRTQLGIAQLA